MQQTKIRHDYTNEVELKSLSMRERNKHNSIGTTDANAEINNLILEYVKTKDLKVKDKILELSKITQIDKDSHERFGEIVLLMIKRILTKPNYSGYSWTDEFYSTACYRVFKYIHNFDADKKSERTGNSVSAFSYITQIITMSILEVINKNNKTQKELDRYAEIHDSEFGLNPQTKNESTYMPEVSSDLEYIVDYEFDSLKTEIIKILNESEGNIKVYYPKDYNLSFDEYAEIQGIIKENHKSRCISIIKLKI